MVDMFFAGVCRPVRFMHCPRLLRQVQTFFRAWPSEERSVLGEKPVIRVSSSDREKNGYRIAAPWLKEMLREPTMASALCSLSIELVAAFCEEHPRICCLHGAAVGLGEKHILLLGDNRSGKSTLIARLMADAHRSYGDDLIGLTPQGEIFSFGIPARLRLPLPPSAALSSLAENSRGIRDDRYRYLYADDGLSAPFGHTVPLTHILILQRRPGQKAALVPVEPSSALSYLLPHYVMRSGSAEEVFAQASRLTADIPVLLFRYPDSDEAAGCLPTFLENTGSVRSDSGDKRISVPVRQDLPERSFPQSPEKNVDACRLYVQSPDVRIFSGHDTCFLIGKSSDAVYGLNGLGEIVWKLLEQPLSEDEAGLLLQETFPDTDKSRIEHDISDMFRLLKSRQLIVPC